MTSCNSVSAGKLEFFCGFSSFGPEGVRFASFDPEGVRFASFGFEGVRFVTFGLEGVRFASFDPEGVLKFFLTLPIIIIRYNDFFL